MNYFVRSARTEDATGVAKVQVDSWKSTYTGIVPETYLEKMTYESRQPKWESLIANQLVFVAEKEDGEIIGFANGGRKRTSEYPDFAGEIYAIYILKSHQSQGVGRHLMKALVERMTTEGMNSLIVSVLKDNPYRPFYEKLGFVPLDTKEIRIDDAMLHEMVMGCHGLQNIIHPH
ncbi:GNAT family N-acetyltransferase [Halobacillus salinus]|uniref:GNAT family N-acetyltransferase n=1 Tax=Halobacillus salinus TaxID=192814 RepID=A0A4Z0H649_9BACI|nr:GNAT family N-acetyltransferase [Halobacillus salinus]TGB05287.1 GNAT family N-acetyltransferase [Halobacillus salinus]